VLEVNAVSGALISQWAVAGRPNDIAFLPGGEILVTSMGPNVVFRYDPAHNLLGQFAGTNWQRPHGIELSPTTGHILVVDGVTTQVHEFDPVTFAELNANFLAPGPGDKIVDLAFRPVGDPTPVAPTSWGRIKSLYRQ